LYHENIILLLDSFETSHEFCVVTEFAQGELFEILEDDRNLPESEVRKIAQQLVHSPKLARHSACESEEAAQR
jgi:fused-like protein